MTQAKPKAKRKQASVFGFTQQFKADMWDWADDEKAVCFPNGVPDTARIMKRVAERLYVYLIGDIKKANAPDRPHAKDLFKYSAIIHDKDMSFAWDTKTNSKVIVPKELHMHAVIELPSKRDLSFISTAIGIRPEQIEVPRGRYGRENMLAYLVHAKDGDKYQYSPSEVETFNTWDYMSYYISRVDTWNYRKATVVKKANSVKADWLVKEVQAGRVSKETIMLTDDYAEVYADNMRAINDAFQYYAERQGFKTLEALRNNEFEMLVYYIQGAPRMGKTFFAKKFVNDLIDTRFAKTGERWRSYETADTQPMDDYAGEEIVFMDDLRASAMTASGWLKLLDPLTTAPMSARYKNKQKATRVIVITSYLDPFTFFSYVKGVGGSNEALEQFIGRLSLIAKVLRFDGDDRVIEIDGIVQSSEAKHFVVGSNTTLLTTDEVKLLPRVEREHIKSTKFFNENIVSGDVSMALEFMIDDVMTKNDSSKKHIIGEKPRAGFHEDVKSWNEYLNDSE